MEISNEYQVTELICTSGQPIAEQFGDIASRGYTVVINLAMPDHEKSLDHEGSLVTSLGMTYIHIPVPFDAPNENHYARFCAVMNGLGNEKVWVHCIVNARVSAFLFRYMQEHRGQTAEASQSPVLIKWLPDMAQVWREFIDRAPDQPSPEML